MAIAGINYECLYPDVGTNDRVNDGGVWSENKTSALIKDKKLGISPSKLLPDSERLRKVPFLLSGNDAFALKIYLFKLYPSQGFTPEK